MEETSNFFNWWMLIFTGIQTLGVIVAAIFAWKAFSQTNKLSDSQSKLTEKIHNEQLKLSKHQTFVSLFDHLVSLREINSEDPHWEDVSDSANCLELIAIAWFEDMVDKQLLEVVYANIFDRVYKQIETATEGDKKGEVILHRDCKTAVKLYNELNQSRFSKLTKKWTNDV